MKTTIQEHATRIMTRLHGRYPAAVVELDLHERWLHDGRKLGDITIHLKTQLNACGCVIAVDQKFSVKMIEQSILDPVELFIEGLVGNDETCKHGMYWPKGSPA